MTERALTPGRYGLDDLRPGDWWDTGSKEITADQIDRFAALSGDRFEIHMSDEAARAYGFPGRVAHGLLVLSLVDGLKNTSPVELAAVASLSWDWSFRQPVFIGMTLSARISVEAKRLTSKPDRGIATLGFDVRDTNDDTVQRGTNQLMMWHHTS
ncbi:MAG: MaoC family dehydratase [Pseudomonadota bacterium]